jgi:glycosyltransferase involved in cell wall biosynthesis
MDHDGRRLRILAFEGFYGGSHLAFLDGLRAASRHDWHLLTLPARHWRARMKSGAERLAAAASALAGAGPAFDVVFATDMLDLSRLAELLPEPLARLPRLLYFHENQLTYPLRHGGGQTDDFGRVNAASALAADRVVFNSEFHRRDFLAALARAPAFPGGAPAIHHGVAEAIDVRSSVICPGIDVIGIPCPSRGGRTGPLAVLWNHRWEHDKRPEAFFSALARIIELGADFRAIICGESFVRRPAVFDAARQTLGERLEHIGFVPTREAYVGLLGRADVVVSTAAQEFFGIAWLEACAAGCMPLLPERLSYPGLLPPALREECLYRGDAELPDRLAALAAVPGQPRSRCGQWRAIASRYSWPRQARQIDDLLTGLAAGGTRPTGLPPRDRPWPPSGKCRPASSAP